MPLSLVAIAVVVQLAGAARFGGLAMLVQLAGAARFGGLATLVQLAGAAWFGGLATLVQLVGAARFGSNRCDGVAGRLNLLFGSRKQMKFLPASGNG